jgi:hypothetical protein
LIKKCQKLEGSDSFAWLSAAEHDVMKTLQEAAKLTQNDQKAGLTLKTFAFQLNHEITLRMLGQIGHPEDSDSDSDTSEHSATAPSVHSEAVSTRTTAPSNISSTPSSGDMYDGDANNDTSRSGSSVLSRMASVAPRTREVSIVSRHPDEMDTDAPVLQAETGMEESSNSFSVAVKPQSDNMEVDEAATDDSGRLGSAIQLEDLPPRSSTSSPCEFPAPEVLAAAGPRNTYVAQEYKHLPPAQLAQIRKDSLAELRTIVRDIENNGVPDDDKWVPVANLGEVLMGLYNEEARLSRQNAPDTLEVVQALIHTFHVLMDKDDDRKR